jgi:hypothetical protein
MNDRISSTAMMDSAAPSRLATWSSVSNFKFQERVRPNQSSFQLIGIGTRKNRVIKVHRNNLIAQDYEMKRSELMSVGRGSFSNNQGYVASFLGLRRGSANYGCFGTCRDPFRSSA